MSKAKITDNQKELLKELSNIIQKLALEAEKDDVFNSFIADLSIFRSDLLEIFDIILDNMGVKK